MGISRNRGSSAADVPPMNRSRSWPARSSFDLLCGVMLAVALLGGCSAAAPRRAPADRREPARAAAPSAADREGAAAVEVHAPRSEELVALAMAAAPTARTALVLGRGARAIVARLRARGLEVDVQATLTPAPGRSGYDVVVAPDLTRWSEARAVRALVAKDGALVARWLDAERTVARAEGGGRFASFTAPVVAATDERRFEHLVVERPGGSIGGPLGVEAIARRFHLRPSEPSVREISDRSPVPGAPRVRLAGYVVRLGPSELGVVLPHSEQGATRVLVPSLAADLAKAAPPQPARKVSPSFASALETSSTEVDAGSSATIVVLEGRLSLRSWEEERAAPGGARTYDLTEARVTSTVAAGAWDTAIAAYEARTRETVPAAFRKIDPLAAESALDRAVAPVERLVAPEDGVFFGVLRWTARVRGAIRLLPSADAPSELASWASAALPERDLDGPLVDRPRPTAVEREAYRHFFLFAGVLVDRALGRARAAGDKAAACALFGEAVRLLRGYDRASAQLREIERHEAAFAKDCDLTR
ncbi:MAG: hypothetical protein KF850_15345 [Labilithrix sp.]|nr:hypothetical protein [Labilithrix sp.]